MLLGSSGCGKSTTLRMINRLIAVDSGSIRIAGEDIRNVPAEALRRRIGYAIQSIGLFPHWTVEDNIATVPRLLKWQESRLRDRVAGGIRAMHRSHPGPDPGAGRTAILRGEKSGKQQNSCSHLPHGTAELSQPGADDVHPTDEVSYAR